MSNFFANPVAVFWGAIALMSLVPVGVTYWYKLRKAELDTQVKLAMLDKGMSAEDIERVLRAESGSSCGKSPDEEVEAS